MVNNSIETTYLIEKMYAGVVLCDQSGSLLLQQRDYKPKITNPGLVSFFGGSVEQGELFRECAIREIEEELGIVLEHEGLRLAKQMIKIEIDGRANLMQIFFYQLDKSVFSRDLIAFEGELLIVKSSRIFELNLSPTCKLFFENFDVELWRDQSGSSA